MVELINCFYDEFENLLKNKRIICFGYGSKYRVLAENYRIEDNMYIMMDNFNKSDEIVGKCNVIRPEQVESKDINKNTDLIIITSIRFAKEMIEQLDSLTAFDGVACCVADFLQIRDRDLGDAHGKQVIPKVIHYFWVGPNKLPDKYKKNIMGWQELCPDYEFKFWNEENYDFTKCTYMREAYEASKWGFVPDYARLDVIEKYGGIYLDTDVELVKRFDDLLSYDLFCGFESVKYINFGQGFGAKPKHPLIKKIRDDYEGRSFIDKSKRNILIPSPVYQTEALKKIGVVINGVTQKLDNNVFLSPQYLSPLNYYGYGKITDKTHSIHHFDATWMDDNTDVWKKPMLDSYNWVEQRIKLDAHRNLL